MRNRKTGTENFGVPVPVVFAEPSDLFHRFADILPFAFRLPNPDFTPTAALRTYYPFIIKPPELIDCGALTFHDIITRAKGLRNPCISKIAWRKPIFGTVFQTTDIRHILPLEHNLTHHDCNAQPVIPSPPGATLPPAAVSGIARPIDRHIPVSADKKRRFSAMRTTIRIIRHSTATRWAVNQISHTSKSLLMLKS